MSKNELLKLGVSCETISKISVYVDFLLKWNEKINLISKNSISDVWIRHILDSAQLIKFIGSFNQIIVDVGTGGGLPGILLSILGVNKVILIESDVKKTIFLQEITRMLHLNVLIINDRVEKLHVSGDILVSRGFSSLDKIFTTIKNVKCDRMLLLKGEKVESEITFANQNWNFDYKKYQSITNLESYILDIQNVQKK